MSSSRTRSLFSPSYEPDKRELILDSSVSSKIDSSFEPTTSAASTPLQSRSPRYFTSVTAETKNHQKEELIDSLDSSPQPYSRFDIEPEYKQRLPKTNAVQKRPQPSPPSPPPPARMATSFEDISSLRLWKGIIAEFVGTLLLTLIGCGSCINLRGSDNTTSPIVQIALCFGLTVGTIVWAIAHVSGGHINPAVTVAMLAARKVSLAKAVFFILFQLVGAVVGAGILFGLTPETHHGGLGTTTVNKKINLGQAVGVEFFITFVLVFTVFASCDSKRRDLNGSAPLAIGLSVTTCHLWAIDYTGSSMNTARSFGPALVMGEWQDHWVYWLGPLLGGAVAGLLYEHLFAVNASLLKAKACLLSSDYDDDKYKAKRLKIRILEEDSPDEDGDETPMTEHDDEKFTTKV